MAIEFPVKIKFTKDASELNKIKKEVNVGDASGNGGPTGKKVASNTSQILGKLGVIAAILTALKSVLEPILQVIQILVFVAVIFLIKLIQKIIEGVKAVFSPDFWKGIFEILQQGVINLWEAIKSAFEPIANAGVWVWNNIIGPLNTCISWSN